MRRIVGFVLVFGLLGVVVTIGVAWGAAWMEGPSIREFRVIDVRQVNGRPPSAGPVLSEVATNRMTARVTAWSRLPEGTYPIYDSRSPGETPWWVPDLLWCDESKLDFELFCSGERVAMTRWEAAGWPLPALRCGAANMHTPDGKGWMIGGDRGVWTWRMGSFTSPPKSVPVEPVWMGLIGDTVIYGAALFVLWWSPGAIRRAVRGRRGECLRCGYDLRGRSGETACPECGEVVGQGNS
jgi:hypothetical protein